MVRQQLLVAEQRMAALEAQQLQESLDTERLVAVAVDQHDAAAGRRLLLRQPRVGPDGDEAVADDHDTAILIDIDLSILGASAEAYEAYRRAVRREYRVRRRAMLLHSETRQYFGTLSGTVELPDGETVRIENMRIFCEEKLR